MKHVTGIRFASLWAILWVTLCGQASWSQPAIINEWSQGNGGAREWVEILVVQDNLDMRGYKLSDGTHGPGEGVEFNPLFAGWSAVPAGTLIVIYNGGSRHSLLPPDDLDVNDGNFRVIAPHNNIQLFVSNAWQTFTDADVADSPRLWDNANALVHAWDQGDADSFSPYHPLSGRGAVYLGESAAGISDPHQWSTSSAVADWDPGAVTNVSPGKGNGNANTCWIVSLRGSGPLVETTLDRLDFGGVVLNRSHMMGFRLTGYNLDTSITVSVAPSSGFRVRSDTGDSHVWASSVQMDKAGGGIIVRLDPVALGPYSATVTVSSGLNPPATVLCTATSVSTFPANPDDVIVTEFMIGDNGTTPYASLGGATITGDWVELLVVHGPVDLRDWGVLDENTPASSDEGWAPLPPIEYENAALSAVPTGTRILLICQDWAPSALYDLDFSDGKIVLIYDMNGPTYLHDHFLLDPAGDNLAVCAPNGAEGEWKPIDYIGWESNPSSAATLWGLTFGPEFAGLGTNTGCWFSRDAQGGFNNDDGSNTYNTLGYGWNVNPAKTTFTPGAVNPGQGFASIQVSPDHLDFGPISPYNYGTQSLVISNEEGTIPLQINASSAITGADAADFHIQAGQLPLSVFPQQTATLNIVFSPNGDLGLLNHATLNLSHNASSAANLTLVPLSGTSQAGISEQIFYEPFDYAAGSLVAVSGGLWQHASSNTDDYAVEDSTSLQYPNLRPPLGRLARHGRTRHTATPREEDVLRAFNLHTTPTLEEKPLYVSMLVNASNVTSATLSPDGDYFCHFYEGASGFAFRGRLYARQAGSAVQYGVKFSGYGDPVFANSAVPLNQTAFLVMKLTMVPGAAPGQEDRVELFLNPAPDQSEPAPSARALSAGVFHDIQGGIGAFGLRQGEDTIEGTMDEIRVGGSWESVTANSTPPYIAVRRPLWVGRGETKTITRTYLQGADLQSSSPGALTFTLTQLPQHGILLYNGVEMGSASLTAFTQYDINLGRISYRQNGDRVAHDAFLFTLSDSDGLSIQSNFDIVIGGYTRSRDWNLYK